MSLWADETAGARAESSARSSTISAETSTGSGAEVRAAIVLAGGRGTRMGSEKPKQFLPLLGRPLLSWTLEAFEKSSADLVILVAGEGMEELCRKEVVEPFGFRKVRQIVTGGAERYSSVYAGLKALERLSAGPEPAGFGPEFSASGRESAGSGSEPSSCGLVAIHDGARLLVTPEMIDASFEAAEQYGAAAAAVPAKDTSRFVSGDGFFGETVPRERLYWMQTPQTFRFSLCLGAFETLMRDASLQAGVTDDVMVVEHIAGVRSKLIPGSYRNLKVTTPEDLVTAEAFLRARS